MKPLHWFAGGLGAILGIGHIGMIGMIASRNTLPTINPPVGEYSSYTAKVGPDGYEIDYKGNDPKTLEVEKFVDKKNGFFGIGGKSIVTFKEEYTMDGARHLGKNSEGKMSAANVACIKATGGGEQTGRVVGASMGAAAAGYVTGIPFVGPVLGGLVAIFASDKGAEVGGEIATELSEDCEDGDTKD
jgi:hypothetical protein